MNEIQTIQDFFRKQSVAATIARVADCVGGRANVTVVGGALRELVLQSLCGVHANVADLDIAVLSHFEPNVLSDNLGHCEATTFGGLRWFGDYGIQVDIWSARDWAIAVKQPSKRSYTASEIKNFLDFNVNAGYYAAGDDTVDVAAIAASVRTRIFDLHNSLVPPDALQLARILKLECRLAPLGFTFGRALHSYVIDVAMRITDREMDVSRTYFVRKCNSRELSTSMGYFEGRIAELRRGAHNAIAIEPSSSKHAND